MGPSQINTTQVRKHPLRSTEPPFLRPGLCFLAQFSRELLRSRSYSPPDARALLPSAQRSLAIVEHVVESCAPTYAPDLTLLRAETRPQAGDQ
jgi:hypothetical protein